MYSGNYTNIDEYIALHKPEVQKRLNKVRQIIRKAAPEAVETISYAMPAFKLNGIVCWFAAANNHYAIYLEPKIKDCFKSQLQNYSQTKSAIHFKYDDPVPGKLIADIVKYKVNYNLEKGIKKKDKK